ncbi:MAG TPA: protein kinase, partial [Polyangiaceae bacterium]|nr:protein kinase [Polyangiaceae bacterium]
DEGDVRTARLTRPPIHLLAKAVDRALAGEPAELGEAVREVAANLSQVVPLPIASLVAATLERVPDLPRRSRKILSVPPTDNVLPSWIPPRRTLGGFYVLRSLGKGGVGSVFVAKRVEERNDPAAESFALKVPEYDESAARHMSEADFLKMFQSEATALLSLPMHQNLARFVTFDLGLRPKPILVMELVDGVTLEMLIARRQLTTERALGILDGVLGGLEAMHSVGVAHLDLKPTNVVMRQGKEPVLVDFGLAGRHIRLGCGSGPYGAPEIWGLVTDDEPASPTPADVYAVACLTYETLTTQPLFDQTTEMDLIQGHMSHDGWPTPLRSWYRQKEVALLAQLVGHCLRRNPGERIDVARFRKDLAKLVPELSKLPWPLNP